MSVQFRSIWFWLSALALAILAVFLLYPLLNVLTGSIGSGSRNGWVTLAGDPKYFAAIVNTVVLGIAVTLTTTLIGVPLAYFTARFDFPGKGIVAVLPLITLVIPEVIAAQTWLMMLGNNGFITRWLGGHGIDMPSFYGWPGLITVMTFTYYTYTYIGTLAAIRGFDVQLEEAAQSLGTSPAQSRLKVMLPVVLPSVLASALLVFTLVVGNFATATILGSRVPLLSVLTYQAAVAEGGSDPVMQSTLATVSIALVMIVLFVQRWIVARGRHEVTQGRGARAERLRGLPGLVIGLSAAVLVIVSLLPLGSIVVGAFTVSRGPVMRWGEWTTAHVERLVRIAPDPVINTLLYSAAATAIGITFSALVSYLIVKKRNILTPALDYLTALPLALSGTIIGIGLIMSFNTGFLPLTGTASIIVLAYVVRRLPFGIRNSSSTLYNIPNSIEEASISLGVPPVATFFKVVLPLMLPAVAAATVLTWTTTVAELSASIIVYSGGRETMPIQIYKLIDSNLMAPASAYGLVLVAVILIPIIVATRVFKIDLFSSKA
ncbi:Ferric iron ABC transporter permease protein [Bosea sp. 62]|uniref:ABC transporter permease n=1 Tax=unclassified Bosea (in: a-proteobacteria) TaxID=2653178 RepID=UPI001252812C|nr:MULTISPECIES: iron ABC transporter permease [unclassified Bosea (in: a-proteobacteria)]CAD5296854.1 Ferric iron ABC transporter permease protein [Bosea sp. 7B]CAD5296969.1 Ferric iron ABC transporter permease protein [Bosea sp. 21B]CAD5297242.1 Ferric iron ABC transporter permease protein [Bosea sp. 46]VVT61214.1 Ferric iron ABC transporter permease protein [Bosea sp. EC-HK365B]VXB19855.1 Ferric iron ABC transporter permease protein [Bosea sp. 125]